MDGAAKYLRMPYVYGGNDPVRGLNCSSYVSLIWGIPRRSTDAIHNYSLEIDRNDPMSGDAMNFPFQGRRSQKRLFAGWATEDHSAVWVYECAFRRGANTRPIAHDDRYTPIRRANCVPDVPQPEPSLPDDHEVPGGWFYSQTVKGSGLSGFAVLDKDDVRMWTEFLKLGGVAAFGYPLARRFHLLARPSSALSAAPCAGAPTSATQRSSSAFPSHSTRPVPHPSPLAEPSDPGAMTGFPPPRR